VRSSPITSKCLVHIDAELIGLARVLPAVHRDRYPLQQPLRHPLDHLLAARSINEIPIIGLFFSSVTKQDLSCYPTRLRGLLFGIFLRSFPILRLFSDLFLSDSTAYQSSPGNSQNSIQYTLRFLVNCMRDVCQSGKASTELFFREVLRKFAPL